MNTEAIGAKRILDWNYNPIERQDIDKQKYSIFFEYDDAEDALLDLVLDGKGFTRKFAGLNHIDFEKVTEPVIHEGVKLGMYFIWKKYIFCQIMGLYQFTGEMSK